MDSRTSWWTPVRMPDWEYLRCRSKLASVLTSRDLMVCAILTFVVYTFFTVTTSSWYTLFIWRSWSYAGFLYVWYRASPEYDSGCVEIPHRTGPKANSLIAHNLQPLYHLGLESGLIKGNGRSRSFVTLVLSIPLFQLALQRKWARAHFWKSTEELKLLHYGQYEFWRLLQFAILVELYGRGVYLSEVNWNRGSFN